MDWESDVDFRVPSLDGTHPELVPEALHGTHGFLEASCSVSISLSIPAHLRCDEGS